MPADRRSPHILNTSANLLGFCFVVLTSVRISKFSASTSIDEVTGVACLLLMASCILSFLAMRNKDTHKSDRLEYIADIIFLSALLFVTITIALVAFNLFEVQPNS